MNIEKKIIIFLNIVIFLILFYVVFSFQKYFHLIYHDYFVPFSIDSLSPEWGRIPASILYRLTKDILPNFLSIHPQDFICTIEAGIKALSFISICIICSMGFFATAKERFNIENAENIFLLPFVFLFFSMPLLSMYQNNLFFGRMNESVVYFEYFFCFLFYFSFFIFLIYINLSRKKISLFLKTIMFFNSFLLGFWIEWFNISTFFAIIIFLIIIRIFNKTLLNNKNLFGLILFFLFGMVCFYLFSSYFTGTKLVNYSYNWSDLLPIIKSNLYDFVFYYLKYMFLDKIYFYIVIVFFLYFLWKRRNYNINIVLITCISLLLGYLIMNLSLIIYRDAQTIDYSGFLFQAEQYEILYITVLEFVIILLMGAFYFEYFNYRKNVLAVIIVINIILFSVFIPNYVQIQNENKNTKMLVYSIEKNILVYSILGETAILPVSYLRKPAIYNKEIFIFNDKYSFNEYITDNEIKKLSLFMKNKYFDNTYFYFSDYFEETYKKHFLGVTFVDDKIADQELEKRLKLLNYKKETKHEILENNISFKRLNEFKKYRISIKDIDKMKISKENKYVILKLRAYLNYRDGKLKEALKLYSEYLKKNPKDFDALKNIADIYERLQDIKNAEKIYLKLNKIDNNNLTFLYKLLKIYYYDQKDYKKALDICNKMINIQDDMLNLYLNKAVIYLAMGKKSKAREIMKNVEEQDINKIEKFLELNGVSSFEELYEFDNISILEPEF